MTQPTPELKEYLKAKAAFRASREKARATERARAEAVTRVALVEKLISVRNGLPDEVKEFAKFEECANRPAIALDIPGCRPIAIFASVDGGIIAIVDGRPAFYLASSDDLSEAIGCAVDEAGLGVTP